MDLFSRRWGHQALVTQIDQHQSDALAFLAYGIDPHIAKETSMSLLFALLLIGLPSAALVYDYFTNTKKHSISRI